MRAASGHALDGVGIRLTRLMMVTALALVAMTVVTTDVAHANSTRILRDANTGRCLDDRPNQALQSRSCDGSGYQLWIAHTWSTGVDEFSSYITGLCVDDSITYNLRAYSCNGQSYQRWRVIWHGAWAELKNLNTGRCLDDSRAHGLRAIACNGTNYQRWHL
ncbi:RICIN domain-containing protein [Actinocatenispora rupis]|uniref:Ricin B lectin domain-containing protein n=1 Tax=Actinocatenispora rupis TaxID=519421 RepID=A0A8J3JBH8_9ACTN|nr:ricin-type beta-trefoil lectin domain protein [Actinocatenispora rupis]GID15385.1 hypothetical protein Aru02nite_62740 [Actinocatenispora rupis]